MKRIIFLSFTLFMGLQGFAQFNGSAKSLLKLKTYFDRIENYQYLPLEKSLTRSDLPQEIVDMMEMSKLKVSSAPDAQYTYKAIGYYEHNDNYITFFYFSFIPEQENYSPLASLHVQTIDKNVLKAVAHYSFGNKMSSTIESLISAWKRERYTSYLENGEIVFRKEKMAFADETKVEKTSFIYFDSKEGTFYIK